MPRPYQIKALVFGGTRPDPHAYAKSRVDNLNYVSPRPNVKIHSESISFLPLDEAIASTAGFVIVSGSNLRTDGRAETLLKPANSLRDGKR